MDKVSPNLRSTTPSNAGILVVAAAVIIAGLWWFADLLKPLALAIFLWLTIDAFADSLSKRLKFISKGWAIPIAVLIVFLSLAFIVGFVIEYATSFSGSLVQYQTRLDALLAQAHGLLNLAGAPPTVGGLFAKVNPSILLRGVADTLQSFGGQALFVIIYVASLFAAQASLPKKMVQIFGRGAELSRASQISKAISRSMEQYLWVQTITGVMIAVACWALFTVMGLENALFWAMVTFVLSYIPVVGGIAASVLPALFALVQFTSPIPALVIFGVSQTIQFVVGNVIQPRMTGDSLNISVLVVFLSLAFWGKLWGGPGMFLAVPLTVMMMIILAQFPSTRWIAVMMSNNGNPDSSVPPLRAARDSEDVEGKSKIQSDAPPDAN
jgi:AI-2 transport protein TqsA